MCKVHSNPLFHSIHHRFTSKHTLILRSKNTVVMIQFQTTVIYSSMGRGNKNKLYIISAVLQTNEMFCWPKPSVFTQSDEETFMFLCRCVFQYYMCALSAAGQCTQRGMAVHAAVCFRGHGGVTAWVRGLCGH